MSCFSYFDCCLRNSQDQYKRAMEYLNRAEETRKLLNNKKQLRGWDFKCNSEGVYEYGNAFKLFKRAAAQGHTEAQFQMGQLCLRRANIEYSRLDEVRDIIPRGFHPGNFLQNRTDLYAIGKEQLKVAAKKNHKGAIKIVKQLEDKEKAAKAAGDAFRSEEFKRNQQSKSYEEPLRETSPVLLFHEPETLIRVSQNAYYITITPFSFIGGRPENLHLYVATNPDNPSFAKIQGISPNISFNVNEICKISIQAEGVRGRDGDNGAVALYGGNGGNGSHGENGGDGGYVKITLDKSNAGLKDKFEISVKGGEGGRGGIGGMGGWPNGVWGVSGYYGSNGAEGSVEFIIQD